MSGAMRKAMAILITAGVAVQSGASAQSAEYVGSTRVEGTMSGSTPGAVSKAAIAVPSDVRRIAQANDTTSGSGTTKRVEDKLALANPRCLPLPEIESSHEANASMDLAEPSIEPEGWSFGEAIKLEASYNESITLKDVLEHVLKHNLPIKIARESYLYQRGQLVAAAAGFLPTYSTTYRKTGYTVFPDTKAPSQLYINEVRYPVFLGGAVFYRALGQHYRNRAWKESYQNSIEESLLDAYKKYSDLVLQNMLLKIRMKGVTLAETNLRLIEGSYQAGVATQFDIMQSRTQLANEKEQLYQQQLATRSAAMALCFVLNAPLLINFLPKETVLKEQEILSAQLNIVDYENVALKERPELRQYENFRLAAGRSVQSATAAYYPQVSLFTTYTVAQTNINIPQNVDLLNGVAAAEVAQAEENIGVVTNTALDQTASFSPGESNTAQEGANTLSDVVAGGGGNPIANVQSGSLVTSGAVKPTFGSSAITGGPTTSNIQGSNTASAGIFPGHSQNFQMGMNFNWNMFNLGVSPVCTILSARSLSRQAMLQANQELLLVMKQVHATYLGVQVAKRRVDANASASGYAREALRMARLRLRSGLGSNLELIASQNAYIHALSNQARAITTVNQTQAQLLKDVGVISVDTLTNGYR